MLQLVATSRHFGATRAVEDVHLSVEPGQMVGIIGRSGAGKSTLLRLINRLIEPTAGSIRFGDEDVSALRGRALRAWRARSAMIFQQFNLVGRLDVLTNVLIGCIGRKHTLPALVRHFSAAERTLAARALERMDLLPQALQRAETLSGGQQQRVAIARALVQRPDLILADEPIASLDPANAQRVMEALRRINREDGITVLCNLHHLDTARAFCDRIVGMAHGRIVFDGLPAELDAGQAAAIYGADAASDPDRLAARPAVTGGAAGEPSMPLAPAS